MISLWVASSPGELRIAVADQIDLLDFSIWRPGMPDGLGDIHLGRIISYRSAIGGAFVDLVNGTGFLPDSAGAKNRIEGESICVRITRSAQGGKGVRLDARNIDIQQKEIGLNTPHQIIPGPSPLEELAKRWPEAPIILDDLHLASLLPPFCRARIQQQAQFMPLEIKQQIEILSEPWVELPARMRASIIPTPALVAIDVDSATQTNENQPKLRAQFSANQLILPFLLYQLRLRNLSGAILIDLAGLPIRKRRLLQPNITEILDKDPLHPKLLGFTHLGLAEINRPRQRPPLHELLNSIHGQATELLQKLEKEIRQEASYGKSIIVQVSIPIASAIEADSWAQREFERRNSCSIRIESNPSFPNHHYKYHYA